MSWSYRRKTDREPPSSYGEITKKKRVRDKKHEPRAQLAAEATRVTQQERVTWARARYLEALHRSRDVGDTDAVLVATTAGRKLELDRELLALKRLTSPPSD